MWTVKPNPRGPRRMIIGGLRLETRGDNSRQGEVSRELAVLDPPGDCTGWGGESSEITAQYSKA